MSLARFPEGATKDSPTPQASSATPYDQLLKDLTRRLRIDPELRLDVMQELRGHLEDSAAEYRAAGHSEEEANRQAVKALGDQNTLAQQLWEANRRRLRLRSVLKWAAQVALIPLAAVVTVVVATRVIVTFAAASMLSSGTPSMNLPLLGGVPQMIVRLAGDDIPGSDSGLYTPSFTRNLTAEQLFILEGDPKATDPVAKEKSISDRWPDNAIYYGNYVNRLCATWSGKKALASNRADPALTAALLQAIEKGRALEPDNAYYDFLKAAILLDGASTLEDDPTRTVETHPWRGARGVQLPKPRLDPAQKLTVLDADMFEQGLLAFRQGLAKPQLSSHAIDMARLRAGLLPAPRRLSDQLQLLIGQISVLLPDLMYYRGAANIVTAYSLQLADQGKRDEALSWTRDCRIFGAKMASNADTLVGLLVGSSIYQRGLEYAATIAPTEPAGGGTPSARASAREQLVADAQRYNDWLQVKDAEEPALYALRGSSVLHSILVPHVAGYQPVDPTPVRLAEYAIADDAGLAALMSILVCAGIAMGVLSLWLAIRHRGESAIPVLFLGWGRLLRICLIAIVLPAAVYAVYAYAASGCTRQVSAEIAADRLALEQAVVIGSMLYLLQRLAHGAIRRRAAELGLPVSPPLSKVARRTGGIVQVILGLAVLAYLVIWHLVAGAQLKSERFGPPICAPYGTGLATIILLYVLIAAAWRWLRVGGPGRRAEVQTTRLRAPAIWALSIYAVGLTAFVATAQSLATTPLALRQFISSPGFISVWLASAGAATAWLLWRAFPSLLSFRWSDSSVQPAFRGVLIRSGLPIFAASVIVVGMLGGWALAQAEAASVRGSGLSQMFLTEIERSNFRHVRDYLSQQHRALLASSATTQP